MDNQNELKKLAGEKAAEYVKDGMKVGLGTGSTVYWTIQKLGQRVKEGLKIEGIPTSKETEKLAMELGIPLTSFDQVSELDITIDGADEFNPTLDLIKGGGGALLREKLVAAASKQLIIVTDSSKRVSVLGKFPLPVEVVPFAWETTIARLSKLGCTTVLRKHGDQPFITDNHNVIVDCSFHAISDPAHLHDQIKRITGVVEVGLFVHMANCVIVGSEKGIEEINR